MQHHFHKKRFFSHTFGVHQHNISSSHINNGSNHEFKLGRPKIYMRGWNSK